MTPLEQQMMSDVAKAIGWDTIEGNWRSALVQIRTGQSAIDELGRYEGLKDAVRCWLDCDFDSPPALAHHKELIERAYERLAQP